MTTCERGCCEWAEDGAVPRYEPHIQGHCDWCGDPISTVDLDAVRDGGDLYCSAKCAGKVGDHG